MPLPKIALPGPAQQGVSPSPLPQAQTPGAPGTLLPAIPVMTWNPSGGWPQSATFRFAQAGLAMVDYSATLFATATGAFGGVQYSIDGTNSSRFAVMFWNVASQHLTVPTVFDVFGSPAGTSPSNPSQGTILAAGSHTIQLVISGANLSSDTGDRAFVRVWRLNPNAAFS